MTHKNLFAALFSLTLFAEPFSGHAMETHSTPGHAQQEFLDSLLRPASLGDFNAQVKLGYIFEKGYGSIDPNYKKAIKWYEKAEDLEYTASRNLVLDTSLLYYARQGLRGHTLNKLADQHESGNGGEPNLQKALELYHSSAFLENIWAQNELACMYLKGKGTAINYDLSIYWFNKAAQQGYPVAQSNLACMYWEGWGVLVDYQKAIYWYKQAGERGSETAQCHLGSIYKNGWGVEANPSDAFMWYKKAAKQGIAKAQNEIGMMYSSGRGTVVNDKKSLYWHLQAALQNDRYGQYNVGSIFNRGRGVTQSDEMAFFWYSKAARQGVTHAQYEVASLYETGRGVTQSDEMAFFWYKQAAVQGFDAAQNNVGNMYARGYGVEIDIDLAFYWFQKAADQGLEVAQTNIETLKEEELQKMHPYWRERFAQYLTPRTVEDFIFLLTKKHTIFNNHVEHYKSLLQHEAQGDLEAKQYLDDIRNFKVRNFKARNKQKALQNDAKKKLIQEAEASLAAKSQKSPSDPSPTATTCTFQAKTSSSTVKNEPKIDISTTATTTSTAATILAKKEPLRLTPVTVVIPREPFVPTEPKEEKIKRKGTADENKMKDKEENEKRIKHKEPTELTPHTFHIFESNQSSRLQKTISDILNTPKEMWRFDEATIIRTLWGLHEAGKINLRNVVPMETGGFTISDNKIVATKVGDSLVTIVVHAHGTWWKDPNIIKKFVHFLRVLSEEDHREFQKEIYNINKDKK